LRNNRALAGPASIQVALNVTFAQRDARRATIDHHADTATVRLAKCRDPK
jgi:hypothetical protein